MKQVLRKDWVERIFSRLLGIYGAQFKSKFSSVENGVDVGLENAKDIWAEELGTFCTRPDAIQYALENLPSERAPNAVEFRDICRRAPRKEAPALTHKPTPEEISHQRDMAKRLGDAIGAGKMQDGIDAHWGTHPRSPAHLAFIFDAAKRDHRFQACIGQMVADGICTAEGKLLKAYRDGAFA